MPALPPRYSPEPSLTFPSRPHTPSLYPLINPTSPSVLLRLPLELRERIYQFALTRDQAFLWPCPSDSIPPAVLTPALLSTCRQIAYEATPLLYKQNRFSFKHPSDCNVFTRIMSRPHTRMIPKVGFHVREKDANLFIAYFSSTDNIRSLSADLPQLQYLIVFLSQTWPHYRDPDDALRGWMQNAALRKLCMALDGHTKAEVTVLCSVRVAEQLFAHLRRGHPEVLVLLGPGHMRTKPVELGAARVMLEVFCAVPEGMMVVGGGER